MFKFYNKFLNFISGKHRSKSAYYSKDYYHESLINKYNTIQAYHKLINGLERANPKTTSKIIGLNDSHRVTELTPKNIKKAFGKPLHVVAKNKDSENVKILFYRHNIGKHKTKLQFHFFNNKLFFYNYTFSHPTLEEKAEIIQVLQEKYLNGNKIDELKEFLIDEKQFVISFNENLYLTLNYFDSTSLIFKKALQYVNDDTSKEKQQKDLNDNMLYNSL